MTGIARVSDRTDGTCSAHPTPIQVGGTIITGSPDVTVDNLPVARLGDMVLADCGHTSLIITASPNSGANNRGGNARLGDLVGSGPYSATIVTSSGTSAAN